MAQAFDIGGLTTGGNDFIAHLMQCLGAVITDAAGAAGNQYPGGRKQLQSGGDFRCHARNR